MELKKNKLIFACGGTGGHIFPAIAVYQQIRKEAPEIEVIFVISQRLRDKQIMEEYNLKYEILGMRPKPNPLSLTRVITFVLVFFKSLAASFKILRKYKPSLVAGFGSFISVPMVLGAFFSKIDIVIHEQNVLPSRSNLLLRHFAGLLLLSFEETKSFLQPKDKIKSVVTGNPLREDCRLWERNKAAVSLGAEIRDFNILISGGSQGAKILNDLIPEALSLLDEDVKRKIFILHLTGGSVDEIQRMYNHGRIKAKVMGFLKNMEWGYSISDMAITRSGALTLSELAYFGLPAVLIPYQYDSGFQLKNAEFYAKAGAAFLIEEKNLTSAGIKEIIEKVIKNAEVILNMKEKMLSFKKNSAQEDFSDIILSTLRSRTGCRDKKAKK